MASIKTHLFTKWNKATNVDSFSDVGTTLDSHSAIGMDLCNPKGIGACAKLKLVRIRGAEQHTIVDSVIMKDTRTICETSAFIDNLLSLQTDCFQSAIPT